MRNGTASGVLRAAGLALLTASVRTGFKIAAKRGAERLPLLSRRIAADWRPAVLALIRLRTRGVAKR
jgi:hypothetical protein